MTPTLQLPATSLWRPSQARTQPVLIAGPCGAETREQVLAAALALAEQGLSLMRLGVWKARTRPNGFAGAGDVALEWVQEARRLTGLKILAEVGNVAQIEASLKAGLDGVWIGARTTVNPFAMQELADALRGTGLPVMVKNPVNPDLNLWIGGIERLNKAGIEDLAACHRGFSLMNRAQYRNAPAWEIPLELKRLLPDLPLICDPSHIAGKAAWVPEVARKAMNLGFDGLMVEVHPNPAQALSDAAQQLDFEQFRRLRLSLTLRRADSPDEDYRHQLDAMRAQIDEMDHALLALLARRMEVVRQIGHLKSENEVRYFQLDRFRQLFTDRMLAAETLGLSDEFTQRLFQLLHLEALEQQGE